MLASKNFCELTYIEINMIYSGLSTKNATKLYNLVKNVSTLLFVGYPSKPINYVSTKMLLQVSIKVTF